MPPTQRSAATAAASTVLAATLALAFAGTAIGKPTAPLAVDATAHPTHTVTYDWSLTKTAQPGGMISTTDNETNVTYEVVATRDGGTASQWTLSGEVGLRNGAEYAFREVVARVIADGASCDVEDDGSVGTLPGGASSTLSYTCTYDAAGPGESPRVEVDVVWQGGGKAVTSVPVAFVKPQKILNDAVDVTDAFDGGSPELLDGGAGLTESRTFTYDRTLATPDADCRAYPNTVHLESVPSTKKGEGEESETASAEVTVCRETPPAPTSTGQIAPVQVASAAPKPKATRRAPRARLRIAKRGPRRARAGSLVRYRITVSTRSKVAARRVIVRDVLPSGLVLATRARGVRVEGRQLTWTVRGLNRKRSVSRVVTLRVLKSARGTRCNRADAIARNASRVRTRSCTRIVQPKSKPVSPAVLG